MLSRGEVQCVFTEASYNRLAASPNVNHPRCIKHGNLITDWIQAPTVEKAREIAKRRAEDE